MRIRLSGAVWTCVHAEDERHAGKIQKKKKCGDVAAAVTMPFTCRWRYRQKYIEIDKTALLSKRPRIIRCLLTFADNGEHDVSFDACCRCRGRISEDDIQYWR
jgi:hypothetical protein